jgi:hypothetical protein
MASMRRRIEACWRIVIEKRTCIVRQTATMAWASKPESARTVSRPVAPAARTRPIVSRRKCPAPRAVLARPSRRRAIRTSPVPAATARSG